MKGDHARDLKGLVSLADNLSVASQSLVAGVARVAEVAKAGAG